MGRYRQHRAYRPTLAERMADARDRVEMAEREEKRLAECDVTRGEYEELCRRLDAVERLAEGER